MRKKLLGWSMVLVAAITAGVIAAGSAAATEPEPIACEANALAHAFDVGGTYVFGANCELMLGTELTLHSGTTLTLESGDHKVTFVGTGGNSPYWAGSGNRFATVDGHLTMEGITVKQFTVGGTKLDGTPGTVGGEGESSSGFNSPPGNGTEQGSAGENGGHGGDGHDAHGGAMLIDGGGVVDLEVVEFREDFAPGGRGGAGGNGGNGGNGGETVGMNEAKEVDTQPGGNGGNGGEGGRGGDAYGGAIENDGTLVVNLSSFASDIALGGTSVGGNGGEGGRGFAGVGAPGGQGGAAGRGGSAFGGAIYNTGSLTITNTEFISDYAGYAAASFSGNGGRGGAGGQRGGAGGDGAAPSPLGIVAGDDVYSAAAFTLSGGRANGVAYPATADGGGGGLGGAACGRTNEARDFNCATNGTDGSPTPGQNPPVAHGQASGDTFVPDPNPGSGEEPGKGGDEKGTGEGGTGEQGTGDGNPGNGTGATGTTGPGSGTGSGTGSNSGGAGGGSNSGGSGSGGGGGNGGHADLGPVTLSGTTATVPVKCPAGGPSCQVSAELTAGGGKHGDVASARRLLKATVLGRASATVRPGHSGALKVKLAAGGRRQFAARHRLSAHLTVRQKVAGKEVVIRSGTVTFKSHG
jgi:hypothetical protein